MWLGCGIFGNDVLFHDIDSNCIFKLTIKVKPFNAFNTLLLMQICPKYSH